MESGVDIDPEYFQEAEYFDGFVPSETCVMTKAATKSQEMFNGKRISIKDRLGPPVFPEQRFVADDLKELHVYICDDIVGVTDRQVSRQPLLPTPPSENTTANVTEMPLYPTTEGILPDDYKLLLKACGIPSSPCSHDRDRTEGANYSLSLGNSSPSAYLDHSNESASDLSNMSTISVHRKPIGSLMDFFNDEFEPEVPRKSVFERLGKKVNSVEVDEPAPLTADDIDGIGWWEDDLAANDSYEAEGKFEILSANDIDGIKWQASPYSDVESLPENDFVKDDDVDSGYVPTTNGADRSAPRLPVHDEINANESRMPSIASADDEDKVKRKYNLAAEEKRDNEDPRWVNLRELKTDKDIFRHIRRRWHNPTIPSLRIELTCQNFRSRTNNRCRYRVDELMQKRSIKRPRDTDDDNGKSDGVGHQMVKRRRTCLEFIDHSISGMYRRVNKTSWVVYHDFQKEAAELAWRQSKALSNTCAQSHFEPSAGELLEFKVRNDEFVRRLFSRRVHQIKSLIMANDNQVNALKRCRDEIISINKMYGRVKQNPASSLVTICENGDSNRATDEMESYDEDNIDNETAENLDEVENMYMFYNSFYSDQQQQQ